MSTVAVGEVQHLCNAIDHGIAQGDDGIYAAQADAVYQVVEDTQTTHLSLFLPAYWRKKFNWR